MADTDNTQGHDQAQSDFEKVQTFIKEQVQTYWNELQGQQQQQAPRTPSQVEYEQQQRNKLIEDTIAPVVGPHIRTAVTEAVDGRDESRFYRQHPEAVDYESQIEEMQAQFKKNGQVIARKDIYDLIVGREANNTPDKHDEKRAARKQAQMEKAQQGADLGSSSIGRERMAASQREFEKLTPDEMEKALEGVTF